MYEATFFNLLHVLHRRHGLDALALAGGCAMNSVANGKAFLRHCRCEPRWRISTKPSAERIETTSVDVRLTSPTPLADCKLN